MVPTALFVHHCFLAAACPLNAAVLARQVAKIAPETKVLALADQAKAYNLSLIFVLGLAPQLKCIAPYNQGPPKGLGCFQSTRQSSTLFVRLCFSMIMQGSR